MAESRIDPYQWGENKKEEFEAQDVGLRNQEKRKKNQEQAAKDKFELAIVKEANDYLVTA